MQIPLWRRLGASVLLGGAGAWFVTQGLAGMFRFSEVLYGAMLVVGAALLGRRGVVSQVLGRGAGWALFGPVALEIGAELLVGWRPSLDMLVMGAISGTALFLARPMLSTAEAKAAFAPLAYRRLLLFAASAAAAFGVVFATATAISTSYSSPFPRSARLLVGATTVSLFASAIGVARMRAWGVLAGGATAVLTVTSAALLSSWYPSLRIILASAALPGTLMVGAIAAARASRRPAMERTPSERIELARLPARASAEDADDDDVELDADEVSRIAARV